MNQLDKFSVDFEIWWNSKILRKNTETSLALLLRMFAKEDTQVDYVLAKFHKKRCPFCHGMAFVGLENSELGV